MTQCHGSNKPDALGDRLRFADLAVRPTPPQSRRHRRSAARPEPEQMGRGNPRTGQRHGNRL